MAGPNIQYPSSLSAMFDYGPDGQIVSIKPEWAGLFSSLQKTAFAITRSGPTLQRPTSAMPGRFIGEPYFDTSLTSTVFLASVNPDVWVTWAPAGAGSGTLTSVALSSAISGITVTNSPVTGLGGTFTLLGQPIGSAASTAASTWALAASSYVYSAQLGTAASTASSTYALANSSYVFSSQIGSVASTAASTWALAASSYVYSAQIGSVASTAASTWALAASSYVFSSQIGSVASTAASTWALAASSYVFSSQIGTVASTAASTWALAASSYVYAAQIGTVASTAASTWALAASSYVYSSQIAGMITSVAMSNAAYGITVAGSPIAGPVGTITLGGGAVSSAAFSSAVAGLTVAGSPISSATGTITLSGYPAQTFASSCAQTTISLGLNTFSTATTIPISTGTYFINAQILVGMNGTTSETHFTARLFDGTVTLSNGAASIITTLASSYASIPLGCIVKYSAPTTVALQAAADVTGGFIRGWPWQNSTGSTSAMIQATRLA